MTQDTDHWVAADWTGSNLTVWDMAQETVVATDTMPSTDPLPDLRARSDGLPAIACGPLEGVPRVSVPANPMAQSPIPLTADPIFAMPGLTQTSPRAEMQGAETRIGGFLSLNTNWDGVICLPGDVTIWAQVSADEVVSFQGFLTATLAGHPGFADPANAAWDDAAFATAVDDSLSRPERLAAQLHAATFSDATTSRAWGALVGAELAAARPYWLGQQIAVIGPPATAQPYLQALAQQGVPVTQADPARMTRAGLTQAWRNWRRDNAEKA